MKIYIHTHIVNKDSLGAFQWFYVWQHLIFLLNSLRMFWMKMNIMGHYVLDNLIQIHIFAYRIVWDVAYCISPYYFYMRPSYVNHDLGSSSGDTYVEEGNIWKQKRFKYEKCSEGKKDKDNRRVKRKRKKTRFFFSLAESHTLCENKEKQRKNVKEERKEGRHREVEKAHSKEKNEFGMTEGWICLWGMNKLHTGSASSLFI